MASSSATFGSQWPRGNPNIVTLVRKDGMRIPLHKELAPLVAMLMDLTELMGYDLIPGWCWGYANRPISGTRSPSNHSRGCAVDNNAPVNPYASAAWHKRNANAKPFGLQRRTDIPEAVFRLWEDHGFELGVKYKSKPDPMHFEFTRTVAECKRITARLRGGVDAGNPNTPPKPKGFLMALTDAEQDDLYERVKRLTPWEPERIDRNGKVYKKPSTPNTVVADPKDRWLIEAVNGIRDLLKR